MGTLLAACAIGLYLAWISGWPLLAIGILGALSVVAYTPVLTRIGLGEAAAGLALGTLPVVGAYYLFTGRLDAVAWVSGIPAGLLTYNLLLLNEFPDAEADATGGRRHMVILLGKRVPLAVCGSGGGRLCGGDRGRRRGHAATPWALLLAGRRSLPPRPFRALSNAA